MCNCKWNPLALGLTLGTFSALAMLLIGLAVYFTTYGATVYESLGTAYIGYRPSIGMILMASLLSFVNAFISGSIIALLYNLFNCRPCCCHDKKSCSCANKSKKNEK